MKKIIGAFVVLFCISAKSNECEVQNPSTEKVSEYLLKIAESLTEVKFQSKSFIDLETKKDKNPTDALVAIKELRNGLLCSSSMLSAYKKSKNKIISESAESLSKSYKLLADEFNSIIEEIKEKLNGKEYLPLGEEADKDSDKKIKIRRNWELMMAAIDLSASAAIEQTDQKTGKIQKFLISKNERDLIIKELKTQFKLPMKNSSQIAIDDVASFYYEILSKKMKLK